MCFRWIRCFVGFVVGEGVDVIYVILYVVVEMRSHGEL